MFAKTNNRKALSTVLTTVIILVASVVLGSGVVLYGTSLFQTGAQQENIAVSGIKVWVDPTDASGLTWGAAGVRNNGERIVSVDTIQIRGTNVPTTSWYVDKDQARVSVANFQSSFAHTGTDVNGLMEDSASVTTACDIASFPDATTVELDFDDQAGTQPTLCLAQQTNPVTLNPGERMIVYFKVPNGIITPIDAGASATLNIYAGKTGSPQSITIANP